MPSEELALINEMLRAQPMGELTLAEQRQLVEDAGAALPEGTRAVPADLDEVPAEWVHPTRPATLATVLALRGGGYCLGSLVSNRRFSGLLAHHSGARVLNVGYRNAPEHPFPAALDDALAAYRWLLRTGVDPARIVVAGNSAGGGLTLALLLALRDAGDALPAGAVALCPWTDLTGSGPSQRTNAGTEVVLDPVRIADTALDYAPAERHRDPLVSPLHGDLTGLPPILLHASSTEILLDDSVRFAARARAHGVEVTLEVAEGMPHVWHLFADLLPEADEAMAAAGEWIAAHT